MGFFKKLVWHARARDPACAWRAGSASVVGALATQVLACTPPDRPSRLPEPLPEELLSYLGADSIRALFLHDGLSYHFVWSEKGPWAVHVLRLDLGRCDLGLRVLPAGETGLHGAGLSTVTELVGKASRGVLAAVNGDFFTPEGRPLGSEVAVGRILWSRERPGLEWTPGRAPWIGMVVREGSGLSAGIRVSRSRPGRTQVIGGYPELLDEGDPLMNENSGSDQGFASLRHPRTAVAYDPKARRLWVVVVDGRQGSYSSGMTLAEMTAAPCGDRCGGGAQSRRGRFVRDGRPWTNNEPPVRRRGRTGRSECLGGRERPGVLPGRTLILLNRCGASAALNPPAALNSRAPSCAAPL